jgi:hypothetical protein
MYYLITLRTNWLTDVSANFQPFCYVHSNTQGRELGRLNVNCKYNELLADICLLPTVQNHSRHLQIDLSAAIYYILKYYC